MKKTLIILSMIILSIIFNTYSEALPSPLIDTAAVRESFSDLVETHDILLNNRDIRKFDLNPKYKRYQAIFRITFSEGAENRPMTIEIAQEYSNDYDIIHKMTTGSFEVVNNFVYPSGDGIKLVYTDSITKNVKEKADELFDVLRNFLPVKIISSGTCMYRIEFKDLRKSYYFENTIFCSNNDNNYKKIIKAVKSITKEVASSKKFDLDPFKSWADKEY